MLNSEHFRALSQLSRAAGIEHPRVAQLLGLTMLPPEIQAALDVPFEGLPARTTQAGVRSLARMSGGEVQQARFTER